MNLTFSAHALDRCFERGISLQLIAMPFFRDAWNATATVMSWFMDGSKS